MSESSGQTPGGDRTNAVRPADRDSLRTGRLRHRRLAAIAIALVLVVGAISVAAAAATGSAKLSVQKTKEITLVSPTYTPRGVFGGTDDYHCTLLNPHVIQDSSIISSQFLPGSAEDHHAILSLVPPSLAATALAENAATGGKGWSCFGAPELPNSTTLQFLGTQWLSVWAPGHGVDVLPRGTGVRLPVGSLIIMQVHYNLLVGDKPVKNQFVINTVPASAPLLPLHLQLGLAPPDVPCPAGVTGPLCNRAASIASLGRQFGPARWRPPTGSSRPADAIPPTLRSGTVRRAFGPLGRAGTSCAPRPTCTCWGPVSALSLIRERRRRRPCSTYRTTTSTTRRRTT